MAVHYDERIARVLAGASSEASVVTGEPGGFDVGIGAGNTNTAQALVDGFFEAAKKFAREEGMDGIIQSLPVTYAKMVPYTAVQLASFEVLKVALADVGDASVIKTSSAVLAGIAASLSSQPGDTLLSVRNSGSLNAAVTTADSLGADAAVMAPESVFDTIIRLGPAGLMTGWRARLVHVTTIVVVQLLVYDSIKSALLSRVG